jgi:hypothetical protein
VIKQVWSGDNVRCRNDKTKFDQMIMEGSRVIKQMLTGDQTSLIKW